MANIITLLIILLIAAAAVFHLIKEKKKGRKCIGCPYCDSCNEKKDCKKE